MSAPATSAHVCTQEAPPSNWVGNIAPGTRCSDGTAKYWDCPILGGSHQYTDANDRAVAFAKRHGHPEPELLGLWHLSLDAKVNGRQWSTQTQAVMDDFGWLVEVPA